MAAYTTRLHEVMAHLRSEFLDRLTSCMFATVRIFTLRTLALADLQQESYFTSGAELMKALAPAMAEKRAALDRERAAFVDKLTCMASFSPHSFGVLILNHVACSGVRGATPVGP